jgi:DNA topoisomerase-1
VKYGSKYVSLKVDDPYEITPERALEVIRDKEIADANRLILDFPDAGIQVLNGRYGPYITDKSRNAKIPKDKQPKSLTLEECQSLLAAAPVRSFGKWGRKSQGQNGKAKPSDGTSKRAAANGSADGRSGVGAPKKRAAKGGMSAVAPRLATPASGIQAAPSRLAAKDAKASADKKAPAKSAARPRTKAKRSAKRKP